MTEVRGVNFVNVPKVVEFIPIPEKSVRRICDPKSNSVMCENFVIPDPDYSFGPFYHEKESKSSACAKEEAWKKIIEEEKMRKEETIQDYLTSIRRVEKEAREAYGGDAALVQFTESESKFRWMMIKDGCFFLQLTLYLLDDSGEVDLGYPDSDHIFGNKVKRSIKAFMGPIKSMFLVGNQIPLVVLTELMDRKYFQKIIKSKSSWERPSDMLSKQILYDLLLGPKLPKAKSWWAKEELLTSSLSSSFKPWNALRFLIVSCLPKPTERPPYYSSHKEKPTDLLHGLQLFLLGWHVDEGGDEQLEDEDLEDADLEAGIKLKYPNTTSVNSSPEEEEEETRRDTKIFKKQISHFFTIKEELENNKKLSACNLNKKWVYIMNYCRGGGSRGIFFQSLWLVGRLHIPPLKVSQDTNVLFTNLKYYEILHQQREVRSYINFLANLVSTYEDVNFLASKKIIDENTSSENKQRFLDMLRNLSDKEALFLTQRHQSIIGRVKDYSAFPWENLKLIAILIFILTILQTAFGILSWKVGKQQLHQVSSTSLSG